MNGGMKININMNKNYILEYKIKKFKEFNKINEIFNGDKIYDISLDKVDEPTNDFCKSYGIKKFKSYRYSFITKDNIKYKVGLIIEGEKGQIDFCTDSKNKEHCSIIHLINTGDVYVVINTLKAIIDRHKEIKKLIIDSTEDRMKFYEKLLKYMKIKNKYVDGHLIGYIN